MRLPSLDEHFGSATTDGFVWRDARVATLQPGASDALGCVEKGAIAVRAGRIAFVGAEQDLPGDVADLPAFDLGGRWVTPAMIDCHTHLVHGGDRAREFEMRLEGATYEAIARASGGIVSSVRATRALDVEGLVKATLPRLDTLLREGVSTVEIKSGYGLDIASEIAMLRAARALGRVRPVRVLTTWLAAHATPAEYRGRNRDYIAEVVLPGLDQAHAEGLVDAVDGFLEGIAFSADDLAPVFERAKSLGLPVKLHADQLSDGGGAAFAARFDALSADHLEYLGTEGIAAMATRGTVAVLLPGAFYAIRETRKPPVEALRQAGVPIAVATDCNPGTSPLTSLLLAMNMAATLFGLTVAECLAATTREAARALGLGKETGTLTVGRSADLTAWDIESPAELVYRIGFNPAAARVFRGQRTA